jgi:hypothetical protein
VPRPPEDNFGAMWERHCGCLTMLVAVAAFYVSSRFMYLLAQFLYISAAYGRAAWDGGLRLVGKHGHLSNGADLAAWGNVVIGLGTYLLTVPVLAAVPLGLPYLTMRLRGERRAEQLDRWEAENPQRGRPTHGPPAA